jgi:hypothetical protein
MPNRMKMTIPEIFLRARVREINRLLGQAPPLDVAIARLRATPATPPPAGNARVIATWPTRQRSTIELRSYQTKGVSYRVW